jgi:hypothetical protein
MTSEAGMNRVFVDFENVPTVDLALIGDKAMEVTLLIGEKQRRLELGLVRQIHAHAAKVALIEVGASGRNALDMVLAWHLGRVAERNPDDSYWVISKDKDFDPLIVHLRTRGLRITRVDAFSALPFFGGVSSPRKTAAGARPLSPEDNPSTPRPREKKTSTAAGSSNSVDDRLAKLIDRLEHKTKARPVRRKTLLSHINGFYGNQLSEPELEAIAETLQRRAIISIDARGRVTYQ